MSPTEQPVFGRFSVFSLSRENSPSDVTLRSAEWAVITQLDGHKTIEEIAKSIAFSLEEAIDIFSGLFSKGLVDFISAEKVKQSLVPIDFFKRVENALIRIIGPVANFVIDDVLWTMNEKKETFRTDRIAELIEAITEEIPDGTKKLAFQKQMLDLIKEVDHK
jgi:hypothetical protein